MSKATTLLILALLLFSTLSYAARTGPVFSQPDTTATVISLQHRGVVAEGSGEEEKCGEGVGEEECLMRRTLAAHLDYIYTQKKNP